MNENLPFLVIGHRGCAGIEPENTLIGVRRAIELGCPMVEIDVYLVDGELVVIHDDTVDRTSNGYGKLYDFRLHELRLLDFGEGESIPLLSDVLDLCVGRVAVNVELKGEGSALAVVELLKQRGGMDDVVISSFHWEMLRAVRKVSSLPIAVLVEKKAAVERAFGLVNELGAMGINCSIRIVTEEVVAQAHDVGLLVSVYTVRSIRDAEKVLASGADACFADDPRVVMALL